MRVLLTALNAKYIHSSLALYSLKSYLNACLPKPEMQIQLKEYTVNNNLFDILADIYPRKPDLVGLACYIWNIEETLKLAGLLKKTLPKTKIALGGPEVSYGSYDFFDIPANYSYIDYIILGEGEKTFASLVDMVIAGGDFEKNGNIPGLLYCLGNNSKCEAEPKVIENLDNLPFPYDSSDMTALKDKIIYYESSRGCPFSCQYCLSSATSGVRFLSLDRVFKDLEFFIRHNVKQVKFVDRTFNASKSHYLPILKFLTEQDCRTNFHFEVAADIWDEEALEILKLAPAGRFQLEVGVQSTHAPTLKAIKRHNNFEKIAKNVGRIKKSGNIHLHLDLIAGLPYEDLTAFSKSFNDAYCLEPDLLQVGFLKLLKGCGLRKKTKIKEHGYIFTDNAPYEVLSNNYLSYDDVRKLKIFEKVFDLINNSGKFRYGLKWLIKTLEKEESAFSFYEKLSAYWEGNDLQYLAHSSNSLYQYLAGFCQNNWPDFYPVFLEFLKFDFLRTQKWVNCPEFLNFNQIYKPSVENSDSPKISWQDEKNAFWKNSDLVRLYLPDFIFTTWREVKKNYHIEVFSVDIPIFIQTGTNLKTQNTAVLFSFNEKTREVTFQVIDAAHFQTRLNL